MDTGYHKNFVANEVIEPFRLVALNADGSAKQAEAGTDAIIGTTLEHGSKNERVDVCMGRIPRTTAGEALQAGDKITANSDGKAVKAADGDNIIGIVYKPATAERLVDFIIK